MTSTSSVRRVLTSALAVSIAVAGPACSEEAEPATTAEERTDTEAEGGDGGEDGPPTTEIGPPTTAEGAGEHTVTLDEGTGLAIVTVEVEQGQPYRVAFDQREGSWDAAVAVAVDTAAVAEGLRAAEPHLIEAGVIPDGLFPADDGDLVDQVFPDDVAAHVADVGGRLGGAWARPDLDVAGLRVVDSVLLPDHPVGTRGDGRFVTGDIAPAAGTLTVVVFEYGSEVPAAHSGLVAVETAAPLTADELTTFFSTQRFPTDEVAAFLGAEDFLPNT